MLLLHIAGGLIATVAGFTTVLAPKGRLVHRVAGRVFMCAMLTMTGTGLFIAAFESHNPGNVVVSTMTGYLVVTGWLAARRDGLGSRRVLIGAVTAAAVGTGCAYVFAWAALQNGSRVVGTASAEGLLLFAVVGTLGIASDLRLLRRGSIHGAARVLRHLWRTTFALFIVAISFFLGQAKFFFPAVVRDRGVLLLTIPVLLVLLLLVFYTCKYAIAAHTIRKQRHPPAHTPVTTEPKYATKA